MTESLALRPWPTRLEANFNQAEFPGPGAAAGGASARRARVRLGTRLRMLPAGMPPCRRCLTHAAKDTHDRQEESQY